MDGDMINRVLPEGEGSIDRRMQFIPVTPPVQVNILLHAVKHLQTTPLETLSQF